MGALHAHCDGVRAAASRASQRSRACPPECAGGRAGAGVISAADAMSDSMGKAVCEAARNGNEAELTRLIERGGNVNWHNPEDGGWTALMLASNKGHEGCVRLLLETEAIEVDDTDVSLELALSQHNAKGLLT